MPFMESMSDGILLFDSSTLELLTCNKGCYAMLGYISENHFLEEMRSFTDLLVTSEGEHALDVPLVIQMAKNIQGITLDVAVRKRIDPDKEEDMDFNSCQTEMRITTFEMDGREFNTAVFRDVTQEKIYRRKDELLAFLSHELRNPLQVRAWPRNEDT